MPDLSSFSWYCYAAPGLALQLRIPKAVEREKERRIKLHKDAAAASAAAALEKDKSKNITMPDIEGVKHRHVRLGDILGNVKEGVFSLTSCELPPADQSMIQSATESNTNYKLSQTTLPPHSYLVGEYEKAKHISVRHQKVIERKEDMFLSKFDTMLVGIERKKHRQQQIVSMKRDNKLIQSNSNEIGQPYNVRYDNHMEASLSLEQRLDCKGKKRIKILKNSQIESSTFTNNPRLDWDARASRWLQEAVCALFAKRLLDSVAQRRSLSVLSHLFVPIMTATARKKQLLIKRTTILKQSNPQETLLLMLDVPIIRDLQDGIMLSDCQKDKEQILKTLFDSSRIQVFPEGDYVCYEKEPCCSMFMVISGEIEVVQQQKPITKLTRKDTFGDYSLIVDSTRIASLVAISDSLLLEIPASAFRLASSVLSDDCSKEMLFNTGKRYKELLLKHFSIDVAQIRSLDLLRNITDTDAHKLVSMMFAEILLPGDVIYSYGEKPIHGCCYIQRGTVGLYDCNGQEVKEVNSMSHFGVEEVIFLETRRHTARVKTPTELWWVAKDILNDISLQHPNDVVDYRTRKNHEEEDAMNVTLDQFLNLFPVLNSYSARVRKGIHSNSRPKVFSIGEVLTSRGHIAHAAIFLLRGQLEGTQFINKPTALGINESLNKCQWDTTLRACGRCYAYLLPAATLRRLLCQSPDNKREKLGRFQAMMILNKMRPRNDGMPSAACTAVDVLMTGLKKLKKTNLSDESEKNQKLDKRTDSLNLTDEAVISINDVVTEQKLLLARTLKLHAMGAQVWQQKELSGEAADLALTIDEGNILEACLREKLRELADGTTILPPLKNASLARVESPIEPRIVYEKPSESLEDVVTPRTPLITDDLYLIS